MTSISDTPYLDLAVKATTATTRTAVALGVPTYLFFNLKTPPQSSTSQLLVGSIVILSAPSTLYCALGALEGFARACGHCFKAVTGNNAELSWDRYAKGKNNSSWTCPRHFISSQWIRHHDQ